MSLDLYQIRDLPMGDPQSPIHVILVHGTFAPLAPWTSQNSPFVRSLLDQSALPLRISRFQWTGANNHIARVEAAQALANQLTQLIEKNPDTRILLVSHSHGGNVAQHAVAALPAERCIGAVALATPFFHSYRVSYPLLHWVFPGICSTLVVLATGITIRGFIWFGEWVYTETWLGTYYVWLYSHLPYLQPLALLGGAVWAIWFVFKLIRIPLQWATGHPDEEDSTPSPLASLEPAKCKTLCLWYTPDEAYWGLTLLAHIGQLSDQANLVFQRTSYRLFQFMSYVWIVAAGIYWFLSHSPVHGQLARYYASYFVLELILYLVIAMIVVPITAFVLIEMLRIIISTPLRLAIGTNMSDHFVRNVGLKRTPQIEVDFIELCPLRLNTGSWWDNLRAALPLMAGSLIHSRLYSDPRATEIILKWACLGRQKVKDTP